MESNNAHPLRTILENAATDSGLSMRELTVLSTARDPYRLDTPAGHREAKWFAEMVERFLEPEQRIHLRGLHYRISSVADVVRSDNDMPYINDLDAWVYLVEKASKAARWLGYIPFARIIDERNAPPEIFVAEYSRPESVLARGDRIEVASYYDPMPQFVVSGVVGRQPYRIILFGEKTSLSPILRPLDERIGGEMILPTGEASDTLIAEMIERAAEDGRHAVVLYFSDFDPSGRQMAISVARKLQALCDLLYRDLKIELHQVALTLGQVTRLELPSTPLKETERRANRWRAAMGHEQTEIDALIALDPDELTRIAEAAIAPFYDETLAARCRSAHALWQSVAVDLLASDPRYDDAREAIENAHSKVNIAIADLVAAQDDAEETLSDIEPPPFELPEPKLDEDAPQPLFTSQDDYTTATTRLRQYKALEDEEEA
jgi:hypothetical protein